MVSMCAFTIYMNGKIINKTKENKPFYSKFCDLDLDD